MLWRGPERRAGLVRVGEVRDFSLLLLLLLLLLLVCGGGVVLLVILLVILLLLLLLLLLLEGLLLLLLLLLEGLLLWMGRVRSVRSGSVGEAAQAAANLNVGLKISVVGG